MKQLTIILTNDQYSDLEYYLNKRYGKRGKMENKARAYVLRVIAEEAQKEVDKAMAELEKEDGQPGEVDDEVAMQQAIDGLRAAYDEAGKIQP